MALGDRIKNLRELKGLSQGDIHKRSGLMRSYLSRVENGHTVPSIETLEKLSRALEVPLYRLFFDADEALSLPNLPERVTEEEVVQAGSPERQRFLSRMERLFDQLSEDDRLMLLNAAQRMADRW
jgi:transcriptional regulator with XRE-family HTH domain